MSADVFIFCALNCEAKPLIEAWQLKLLQRRPYLIYANHNYALVISGVGKIAMAGAVAYCMGLFKTKQPVLINLGIAGQAHYPIGSLWLADKIIDDTTSRQFFPSLTFLPEQVSCGLKTWVEPTADYQTDLMFDMEASAFYEMAIRFTAAELIVCLKIISDNFDEAIASISEQKVQDWVSNQIQPIDHLVIKLSHARQRLPNTDDTVFQQIKQTWHFSQTNESKLKLLLQQWQVISEGKRLDWQISEAKNAKQILLWLQNQVDELRFCL